MSLLGMTGIVGNYLNSGELWQYSELTALDVRVLGSGSVRNFSLRHHVQTVGAQSASHQMYTGVKAARARF
jgi:hypothetical protein